MSRTGEAKIQVSVGLTPKTETAIATEAKRLGISFSDQIRRITDRWADDWAKRNEKPAEKIFVLDRDLGQDRLRTAR